MADLSLQDVRDFNAELMTIHAAGVSLRFRSGPSTIDCSCLESLKEALQAIEASVGSAVANGMPLEKALRQSERIPSDYGHALLFWQQTERSPLALDKLYVTARAQQREWGRLTVSLVQPFVWVVLGYCCLVFICVVVAPVFLVLSQQLHAVASPPGPILNLLLWLRAAMPIWSVLIPVILVFSTLSLAARRSRSDMPNPRMGKWGKSTGLQAELTDRAYVTAHAESLITNGVTETEIDRWLRDSGWSKLTPDAGDLPPLVAWAIGQSATDASRLSSRLWQASAIYEAAAQSLDCRSRRLIQPNFRFVLIGGLLVLFVALTVFGPLIEMMLYVSLPSRG